MSKTGKTVLTIISVLLILALLAGIIGTGVVTDGFTDWSGFAGEEAETDGYPAADRSGGVVTEDGTVMESGDVYPLPERMAFTSVSAESTFASDGVTVQAGVQPRDATNRAVDWSLSWKNAASSWANGKSVTDYVTVTPSSDGALTANVNCLKAFGGQIKVTVTSRVNPEAKAECTLDYARRILDTALYHEEMDKNILEFGSDEILLDMEVPDFEGFKDGMSDGTIWAGGYYQTYLNPGVQISPEDEADPEAKWGDESAKRTYQFSDYTIKDCLPFFAEGNEYGVESESQTDVHDDIIDLFCGYAMEANADRGSPIFTFQEITKNGFIVGNNPVMMAIEMLTGYNGVGMSNFDASLYEKYMGLFIDWVQENPDTPIAEYTVTFTGKYSTFTRHYSFRFNPETVEMPVFSLGLDKTEVVI